MSFRPLWPAIWTMPLVYSYDVKLDTVDSGCLYLHSVLNLQKLTDCWGISLLEWNSDEIIRWFIDCFIDCWID